jgi:hypothetical protein
MLGFFNKNRLWLIESKKSGSQSGQKCDVQNISIILLTLAKYDNIIRPCAPMASTSLLISSIFIVLLGSLSASAIIIVIIGVYSPNTNCLFVCLFVCLWRWRGMRPQLECPFFLDFLSKNLIKILKFSKKCR